MNFDGFHEQYTHDVPAEIRPIEPFYVKCPRTSPKAVILERALALNGLLPSACVAQDDASIPTMTLEGTTAIIGYGEKNERLNINTYHDSPRWPQRVDSVDVTVLWTENGETTLWHLPSDLGMHTTAAPADSHPVLTKTSTITQKLLELMILAGHPAEDLEEGELTDIRRGAKAVADIVFNGPEGQLSALERLIRDSVLPCLPSALKHKAPTLLRVSPGRIPAVLAAQDDSAEWPPTAPNPNKKSVRRRQNRLRYENTRFEGIAALLEGKALAPTSPLASPLLKNRPGTKLWDENDCADGRLIELLPEEARLCGLHEYAGATHAQIWTIRRAPYDKALSLVDNEDIRMVMKQVISSLLTMLTQTELEAEKAGTPKSPHVSEALKTLGREYPGPMEDPWSS